MLKIGRFKWNASAFHVIDVKYLTTFIDPLLSWKSGVKCLITFLDLRHMPNFPILSWPLEMTFSGSSHYVNVIVVVLLLADSVVIAVVIVVVVFFIIVNRAAGSSESFKSSLATVDQSSSQQSISSSSSSSSASTSFSVSPPSSHSQYIHNHVRR